MQTTTTKSFTVGQRVIAVGGSIVQRNTCMYLATVIGGTGCLYQIKVDQPRAGQSDTHHWTPEALFDAKDVADAVAYHRAMVATELATLDAQRMAFVNNSDKTLHDFFGALDPTPAAQLNERAYTAFCARQTAQ